MLSLSVVSATDTNLTDEIEVSDVDEEPPSYLESNDLSTNDVVASSDFLNDTYSLSGNDVSMYYKGTANYEVTLFKNDVPVSGASIIIKINCTLRVFKCFNIIF